ncbi:alpha/beta fold hydrolase [Gynuella sp.]|uniref:alpha/beta fold hydrolase n=1 Tax=Gynuella sp. TaxID=2969146 RepID=UPI003D14C316
MNKTELILETPFGKVAGLEWTCPSAEIKTPCVFLHGWLDNAASFDHIIPRLNCSKVYVLDHYGHGGSAHRRDPGFYSIMDHVLFCHAAVDMLKLDRFHLLGHSLGAVVASLWALSDQRIDRLVWLDAAGSLSSPSAHRPESIRTAVHRFFDNPRRSGYESLEVAAKVRAGVDELLSYEAAYALVQRNMVMNGTEYYWRYDPCLKLPTPIRMTEEDVRVCLSAIHQPLLIVLAEQGWPVLNRDELEQRLKCVPHAQVSWLPGGHHFHMNPITVGLPELINQFLSEV